MMDPVEVVRGSGPIVFGMPHTGLNVPDDIQKTLNATGRRLTDTDWNIHLLYDGLLDDVTTVRATFHRYVIDANRDPSGESLYPGQNTTGLCPTTDFDGKPLYREGMEPDEAEVERRLSAFHRPYHTALKAELERVHAKHGVAILYDCHSIRSHIPFLFEGTLPDFNIGTNRGTTCDIEIERIVAACCNSAYGYTSVVNGRFKGGWTTRHYGKPENGVHAIQMELAQRSHLKTEAAPFDLDERNANALRHHLGEILHALDTWARERTSGSK
ncbi:N-formylglutamate deformylase [Hoeflea sp. CAU 1731]